MAKASGTGKKKETATEKKNRLRREKYLADKNAESVDAVEQTEPIEVDNAPIDGTEKTVEPEIAPAEETTAPQKENEEQVDEVPADNPPLPTDPAEESKGGLSTKRAPNGGPSPAEIAQLREENKDRFKKAPITNPEVAQVLDEELEDEGTEPTEVYQCWRGKRLFYTVNKLTEFNHFGLQPARIEIVLDTPQSYRGYHFVTVPIEDLEELDD